MLAVLPSAAREHAVKFGIKAGLNISSLNHIQPLFDVGDNPILAAWPHIDPPRAGFAGGIFIHYHRSGAMFGLQADLLYSQQGARIRYEQRPPVDINEGPLFGGGDRKYNVNYLNLPVVLKFYPVAGLHLMAGLQPGLMITAKCKTPSEGMILQRLHIEDVSSHFRRFDLGLPVGLGYDLKCGLVFEGRYNFGLLEARPERNGSRNHVFQLTVGYRFGADKSRRVRSPESIGWGW